MIGGLLRMSWELLWERLVADVHAAGFDDLRPAHLRFVGNPEPRGIRPTAMARRAGVTKQAGHQLLGHLREQGYVELVPDPTDERARLVELTERGEALVAAVRTSVRAVERDWAAQLGEERLEAVRGALADLLRGAGRIA